MPDGAAESSNVFTVGMQLQLDVLFALKTGQHPFAARSVTLRDLSETHLAIDNGTKVPVDPKRTNRDLEGG